jgi:hypothetical protein
LLFRAHTSRDERQLSDQLRGRQRGSARPYIGYSAESIDFQSRGRLNVQRGQIHVDKRMGHGFQAGASYTFSHTTDEQSALGLFYNGDNPNNLRSGYGLADFDRKHVLNFTYTYQLHNFEPEGSLRGAFTNGWSLNGSPFCRAGSLSASSTSPAPWAAFITAYPTASTIPSFRWLPAARQRAPPPAQTARGSKPEGNRRSKQAASPFHC